MPPLFTCEVAVRVLGFPLSGLRSRKLSGLVLFIRVQASSRAMESEVSLSIRGLNPYPSCPAPL
jgi:hypothetical protein